MENFTPMLFTCLKNYSNDNLSKRMTSHAGHSIPVTSDKAGKNGGKYYEKA
jgi:hypothetical protein